MVWVCLIPPVPLFVLSYFIETQQPLSLLATISLSGWLSILFLSYCSTLIAYAIWGSLLRNYSAIMITPFALLIPVAGILSSSFLLGEELNIIEKISASIIMLGLIFSVFGQSIIRNTKKYFNHVWINFNHIFFNFINQSLLEEALINKPLINLPC